MTDSRNHVAVVTGAAGDIGRAIAEQLSVTHATVVLVDIDAAALDKALSLLSGSNFVAKTCDVTSPEDLSRLAADVALLGDVATLVNNAGAARAVSLHDTTPEIWRKDNALNLEAPFLCFRAFEEPLKRTQGALVNVASVNGMSVFGHPAYSAAKAGLIHLTKLIAVEYGKFGIRSNAVAPGTVRTQAWEARAANNPQVFEEAKHWYPLRRIVKPEDVANAVAFLAGPQAMAISGVCLPVDCGLTAGQAPLAHTFSQSEHY
ncbi:SDR family oxidoreductase [Rhizobium sp. RM]|uniref:SDR family oxidoreductase n=1 Tax=Rhizobium sp. RM TaxID=2748079 RepID=UPI00110D275A|nr:SDR family oxidoreductase [Rhizobium sp. RM]NWJ23365.1 SDR family oxidoreductase [Rhizobium sp. RM]TMV14233.1 SDR family oxidoreductase [Rhizobium sp. Td3]